MSDDGNLLDDMMMTINHKENLIVATETTDGTYAPSDGDDVTRQVALHQQATSGNEKSITQVKVKQKPLKDPKPGR